MIYHETLWSVLFLRGVLVLSTSILTTSALLIVVVNELLVLKGCLRYQLHLLIGFWAYFNCFCEKGVRARHLVGKNVTFSPVREMCRMPEFLLKVLTGSVWSDYFYFDLWKINLILKCLTNIAVILVLLRCYLFNDRGYIQVSAPYLFN